MASRMIAAALGIGCVGWMAAPPAAYGLVLALLLCAALIYFSPHRAVGVVLLCFLLGASYGALHAHRVQASLLPAEQETRSLHAVGRIVSVPQYRPQRGGSYRYEIVVERWLDPCCDATRRLRITHQSAEAPEVGQRWQYELRLRRPRSFVNPGAFDYARWLVSRGIHASGYVRSAMPLEPAPVSLASRRSVLLQKLRSELVGRQQGGILLALAAGDRDFLSERHWRVFRDTGTSHLMAISGLHIGIAAGLGWLLGRILHVVCVRLGRPLGALSPLFGLVFAGVYAWLAGFSLPTQRAFIMVCVAVLALSVARYIGRWQAWSAALLLVLCLNPLASLQVGFWLSFGAVAVLLAVVGRRVGWRALWQTQWALLLGLLPLTLLFFQQASLLAFPVNLVAVPFFSVVLVPLVLLAIGLQWLAPVLASPIWTLADNLLTVFMAVLDWLLAHAGFLLINFAPSGPQFAALGLGGLLLLLPRPLPLRPLALVCLLPFLLRSAPALPEGHYRLQVLDVGQGLSVLVQTRNHALVYDVGPRFSEQFNMVEAALLPLLRQRGVRELGRLIISHDHSDHAGAYPRLLEQMPVVDFISGDPLAGARHCAGGLQWQWDGVRFAILGPESRGVKTGNDRSCVLVIESGTAVTLLPGDIEADSERHLLPELPADIAVLLAPHHGSRTSSTAAFVARLSPEWVIFSAGYKHHFGHPAPEVVERYLQAGSRLLDTAHSGMIAIELGPAGIVALERFRERRRFYWNSLPR